MKAKLLLCLSAMAVLSGCETIQTPQQRRQADLRQQASTRMAEERMLRMQGRTESAEAEIARLMQEVQQLRNDVRACNGQIAQLNSNMQALEAKQSREMQEVVKRVERIVGKAVSSSSRSSSSSNRGAGHEHVVQSGHTLSAIAVAYGTTVDAIKKANNLKGDSIYVGQKLFIPE